jgi:hypothetical protein
MPGLAELVSGPRSVFALTIYLERILALCLSVYTQDAAPSALWCFHPAHKT